MDANIKRFRDLIKSLDEQIEGARKLLDGSGREKADRARAALAQCDEQIRLRTEEVTKARLDAIAMGQSLARGREEKEGISTEIMGARHAFERADATMKSFESRRTNPLNAFGPNTEQILAAIDRDPNWIEKPVRKLFESIWTRRADLFDSSARSVAISKSKIPLLHLWQNLSSARTSTAISLPTSRIERV